MSIYVYILLDQDEKDSFTEHSILKNFIFKYLVNKNSFEFLISISC